MTTTSGGSARRAAPAVLLALGGALVALAAVAGPAAAQTAGPVLIRACYATLDRPGLYVLAADLTCPGDAPAIRITADDVVLNLGGRTLTGDRAGGAGVFAEGTEGNPTVEGLRVENGTVRNFRDGLDIRDAPGARVAGVTAADNRGEGILVNDSPGARIEGNVATDNDFDGLDLNGCDNCRVAGNRVAGNGDEGIYLDASTGARVEGNTVTGNGDDGIDLDSEADGNQVRGNRTTGNSSSGIEVSPGATGNRLEGNAATGNNTGTGEEGGFDLEDENLDPDPPACVNTWRANRFATDNEGDGPAAGCIR